MREDIVFGLSGFAAREGAELVDLLREATELRIEAVLASFRLAPGQVGEATVGALPEAFAARPTRVLEGISLNLLRDGHPLNAKVLDRLLRELPLYQRDLTWSEWIRSRGEAVESSMRRLGQAVVRGSLREAEALPWLSWTLTTPDKPLRDLAVRELYRLGLCNPELLFSRTLSMLELSDPAVPEGLLAASYGVAMTAQDPDGADANAVGRFAASLASSLLDESADQPTGHWLIREYSYRVAQLARWLGCDLVPEYEPSAQPCLPAPSSRLLPPTNITVEREEPELELCRPSQFGVLVGRLGGGAKSRERAEEFADGIRKRIADLGWTEARFGEVDRSIGSAERRRETDPRLERYKEKYARIAFFESVGRLSDAGELFTSASSNYRLGRMPIDPSFPRDARPLPLRLAPWVLNGGPDERWVREARTEVPNHLLRHQFAEADDTWVAIDGFLRHGPAELGRQAHCSVRGVLALGSWRTVDAYLTLAGIDAGTVPESFEDNYCFTGESPWSPTFHSLCTDRKGLVRPHVVRLGKDEDGPEVELTAVRFSWQGESAGRTESDQYLFPGKHLALRLGLRKRAELPEFVDEAGDLAAMVMKVNQEGWSGHLLYLREDLLRAYCAERGGDWGWIVWGERTVRFSERKEEAVPDWVPPLRASGGGRFSRSMSLSLLSGR